MGLVLLIQVQLMMKGTSSGRAGHICLGDTVLGTPGAS